MKERKYKIDGEFVYDSVEQEELVDKIGNEIVDEILAEEKADKEKKMKKKITIAIEVLGGVVCGVHSNSEDVNVVLIDHDNDEDIPTKKLEKFKKQHPHELPIHNFAFKME